MAATRKNSRRLGGAGLALLAGVALTANGAAAQSPTEATVAKPPTFTPIFDARLRYESVDQDGFAKDANAVTMRLRFGLKSMQYHGFSFLVEGETVEGFNDNYNSTTNGRTALPVVADPDSVELNQAYLAYADTDMEAVIGRQRIIFDNARFVGNVGWRQNEQTFDAALGALKAVPDLKLTYVYIGAVQRIFSNSNPAGKFDSDSHLVNLRYTGLPDTVLTGYGYLLDLQEAPAASTATYGLRAITSIPLNADIALALTGEYAFQTDYGDNAGNVDLQYFLAAIGTKYAGFDVSATYEILEGDGTVGFATPLATLHAFQGWADVFLTTPVSGIEDRYTRLGYTFNGFGPFTKIVTAAIYHAYEAERGNASLGDEVNLLAKGILDSNVSVTLKYATYDGPSGGPASRDKLWLQIDYKL
ncbi:MAG: alginate export family protein [Alphaproteobacteria bacterium]|nr:alginate export family protein [Alphaproteobacteria bacterium]